MADATVLLPVQDTPHGDEYDVFRVIADEPSGASGLVAVVPRLLTVVGDGNSGNLRFGVQYLFEAGQPAFASLTAALAVEYDPAKVNEILDFLSKKDGGTASSVASLNGFTYEVSFVVERNGVVTLIDAGTVSDMSAAQAINLDLSDLGKEGLHGLLDGTATTGGFFAEIRAPFAIVEMSSDFDDWKAVIDWVLSTGTLSRSELNMPGDEAIRKFASIREEIEKLLGPPRALKIHGSYALGWDLSDVHLSKKLKEKLEGVKKASYRKIASRYEREAFSSLHGVCSTLKDKILDIATGETGCEGLSK
ncbi:MAG: hypothetical protein EOS73_33905 [Mesorhizobium sp.]|nr:MAG: hypothetical protein EOS73_33905 [Mesorhizobium sp.]